MERALFPFSIYGRRGHPAPSQKPVQDRNARKPRFAFFPETFSVEIDNRDEKFKSGLRRKSFTGETQHPILRQISGGKINIPVVHDDDDEESYDAGKSPEKHVHTSKITQPEKVQSKNNARKQDSGTKPKLGSSGKSRSRSPKKDLFRPLEDETPKKEDRYPKNDYGQLSYDPKKYEEQWSIKKNPPSYDSVVRTPDGYDTEPNKKLGQKLEKLHMGNNNTIVKEEKSGQLSIREEYEAEVKKQDGYIMDNYKLHRFHIIPDGNCLYRAVAQAILLDQSQHLSLRQLAVEHIREHKEEFKDIIEGDIDVFLSAAALEGEWAGYPEVLALSRLLDININITTGGTPRNPNVHSVLHYFAPAEKNDKKQNLSPKQKKEYTTRESIWLSWLNNGHYDTFTEKEMENPHYEEWLYSRESRIQSDAAMANRMHLDETRKGICYENEPIYDKAEDVRSRPTSIVPRTSPKNSPPKTKKKSDDLSDWLTEDLNAAYKSSVDDLNSPLSRQTDYDLAADNHLAPYHYPEATYSRMTPKTTQVEEPPPYSTLSASTDFDEQIARDLQRQEDEDEIRITRRLGSSYYA